MSDQTEEAQAAPVEEAKRIKIGKVRNFTECTLKLRGCKAPTMMGNVFPVDNHTGNMTKPFALACSSCLTKMQDEGKWVISG
jgi:hypothetical protein